MLMVISPAKTLDYESDINTPPPTQPDFLKQSQALVDVLKGYKPPQMAKLMKLSDKLADLNVGRYQEWKRPFTEKNARPALMAFKGDVYTGLAAEELNKNDLKFAQKHLRLLSGLYGLLRPLDLMQPYRLEMGTKLKNPKGKDLYEFWGDTPVTAINEQLKSLKSKELVNLASNEYFKAVDTKLFEGEIITPVFKDFKSGRYKVISFFAKKARGMMVRYAIDNRITKAEDLKGFDVAGYAFNPEMSSAKEWVFTRDEAED